VMSNRRLCAASELTEVTPRMAARQIAISATLSHKWALCREIWRCFAISTIRS
jgi:hypothetical protein